MAGSHRQRSPRGSTASNGEEGPRDNGSMNRRCRGIRAALRCAAGIAFTVGAGLAHPAGSDHDHPQPEVLAPGYADLEYVPPEPGTYSLPPLGTAGDGPVLDSGGEPARLHDLLGDKIVVLSFIYTRCNDINGCPLASHVLRGVQNRLLETPDLSDSVRLVSFSFDPGHDTPAVLADYSGYFRKPDYDWRFLTSRFRGRARSHPRPVRPMGHQGLRRGGQLPRQHFARPARLPDRPRQAHPQHLQRVLSARRHPAERHPHAGDGAGAARLTPAYRERRRPPGPGRPPVGPWAGKSVPIGIRAGSSRPHSGAAGDEAGTGEPWRPVHV